MNTTYFSYSIELLFSTNPLKYPYTIAWLQNTVILNIKIDSPPSENNETPHKFFYSIIFKSMESDFWKW